MSASFYGRPQIAACFYLEGEKMRFEWFRNKKERRFRLVFEFERSVLKEDIRASNKHDAVMISEARYAFHHASKGCVLTDFHEPCSDVLIKRKEETKKGGWYMKRYNKRLLPIRAVYELT